MPKLSSEDRQKRLEGAVVVPEDNYSEFLSPNTKNNDAYRERKMEKLFQDCKQVTNPQFHFCRKYENVKGIVAINVQIKNQILKKFRLLAGFLAVGFSFIPNLFLESMILKFGVAYQLFWNSYLT